MDCMTLSDRQRIFESVSAVLSAALPSALAVYVYGSVARGEDRPDSDLDVAILLPPKVQIPDKLALMAGLSRATGREVDVVSLRDAGLDLVHNVLKDGQQLTVRRPDDVLAWEAEQMTDFALYNPRRADIVAMYMREPLLQTK